MPLGPGYRTEQHLLEVRYIAASSRSVGTEPREVGTSTARLQVHAAYRLQNTGSSALASLEVVLPDEEVYARRNLRVRVDGREIPAQAPQDARAQAIRLPFDPPWPQKQKLNLVIEYELAPNAPGHAGIAVKDDSFHLRHFGWFPALRPPEGLFAKAAPAEEIRLTVRVPEDFRVVSGGREQGARKRSGEAEHRFRLRHQDFDPFVVAGKYHEEQIKTAEGLVVFWTFHPAERDQAQRAAARISAAVETYQTLFQPLARKSPPVWIVETPAKLAHRAEEEAPAGSAFPEGALLNRQAFALGLTSDAFLDLVEHELAHTWFTLRIVPRPEAELVLSESIADYAALVAAEARAGEQARRRQAALLLRWYDEASKQAPEKPLVSLTPADPFEQRVFAYNKGALFFVALEDQFGKEKVRRGLARLVSALQNDRVGFQELRAALELETGANLADFFRAWLYQAGIPEEFRARYAVTPENRK